MRGNRERGAEEETRSKNRVCRGRSPLHVRRRALRIERAAWGVPPTRNTILMGIFAKKTTKPEVSASWLRP